MIGDDHQQGDDHQAGEHRRHGDGGDQRQLARQGAGTDAQPGGAPRDAHGENRYPTPHTVSR